MLNTPPKPATKPAAKASADNPSKKKKKKTPPPGSRKENPPNYSFDPCSAILSSITSHTRTFKCKIMGIPRPQYRNFATTKASATKVKLHNPSKPNQNSFQKAFTQALQKATQFGFNLEGKTVIITIRFFFPHPKKHYISNSLTKKLHLAANAPVYVTKIPDLDNCVKLVLDALQGVCYNNDSVVAQIDAAKIYDHTQLVWEEGQDQTGCTVLKITQIDQNEFEEGCCCLSCKYKPGK